jgi:hypothetical protein
VVVFKHKSKFKDVHATTLQNPYGHPNMNLTFEESKSGAHHHIMADVICST